MIINFIMKSFVVNKFNTKTFAKIPKIVVVSENHADGVDMIKDILYDLHTTGKVDKCCAFIGKTIGNETSKKYNEFIDDIYNGYDKTILQKIINRQITDKIVNGMNDTKYVMNTSDLDLIPSVNDVMVVFDCFNENDLLNMDDVLKNMVYDYENNKQHDIGFIFHLNNNVNLPYGFNSMFEYTFLLNVGNNHRKLFCDYGNIFTNVKSFTTVHSHSTKSDISNAMVIANTNDDGNNYAVKTVFHHKSRTADEYNYFMIEGVL